MISEAQLQQQLALQQLETELLLGVDFIPVSPNANQSFEPQISPNPDENSQTLDALREQVIADFPLCDSLSDATQPVFGEGSETARLMFIGEAPGAEEDKTGRPFVGAAGKKLDDIITAMGYAREQVYIANILRCLYSIIGNTPCFQSRFYHSNRSGFTLLNWQHRVSLKLPDKHKCWDFCV